MIGQPVNDHPACGLIGNCYWFVQVVNAELFFGNYLKGVKFENGLACLLGEGDSGFEFFLQHSF